MPELPMFSSRNAAGVYDRDIPEGGGRDESFGTFSVWRVVRKLWLSRRGAVESETLVSNPAHSLPESALNGEDDSVGEDLRWCAVQTQANKFS